MIPKFRAWDKRRKEMWKVATLHIEDEYADLFKTNIYEKPFDNPWAKFEDLILMQSTGLKDLKGVEIYEGDVVWIIDEAEMDNGWGWFEEVKFRNGSFMAGDDFLINSHHRCVVHDNIYTNPELLTSGIE